MKEGFTYPQHEHVLPHKNSFQEHHDQHDNDFTNA